MGTRSEWIELGEACLRASPIASDPAIEAPLEPVTLFEGIVREAAISAVDLLSSPLAWMSLAPTAAFLRHCLRFRV